MKKKFEKPQRPFKAGGSLTTNGRNCGPISSSIENMAREKTMISGKSVLAIIPAREGSKRVPLKNITIYRGKPLIAWAIEHAKGSQYIDTIIVSSDSDAILNHAQLPVIRLRRPAHLASDHATSEAVIAHALYSSTLLGEPTIPFHDIFVLLQPTSPNRTPADIDACIELTNRTGNRSVSVTTSRQRNGAVYASPTLRFLSDLSLDRAESHVMPDERSLDIDVETDFLR